MNGRWVYEDENGKEIEPYFITQDGRKSIDLSSCDWKENPAQCVVDLCNHPLFNNTTHEIVECEDGSDNYLFVLVERIAS